MSGLPQSPETASIDDLLKKSLALAEETEVYRNREVEGVGKVMEWLTHEGDHASVRLCVTYEPAGVTDPLLWQTEGDMAAHDFVLHFSNTFEPDVIPPEARDIALNDGVEIPDDPINVSCEYELNMDYCSGELNWDETRTYWIDGATEVLVQVDSFDKRTDDETEAAAQDELEIMFGGVGEQIIAERIVERVQQALRFIDLIKYQKPMMGLDFTKAPVGSSLPE